MNFATIIIVEERAYYLGFSSCDGIGPGKFRDLLTHFGTAKAAWEASAKELEPIIKPAATAKLDTFRKKFNLENYLQLLERKQVSFVTVSEPNYPALLSQIPNPPFICYYRGNKELFEQSTTIGVVGARKVTSYGREVTEMITAELTSAGFIIVSGLALGVDAIAHKTCLDNRGLTIAVLGCGVDCPTPTENTDLYHQILENRGLIVSEFPIGMPPSRGSFPSRNRIVSGLSLGIVVTEGAEDSGSLITADYAFKHNRKVFAVPGPITSTMSKGPFQLIQKGAKLVTSGKEILQEFQISNSQFPISNTKKITGDTEDEQKVIDLLYTEPLLFDQLAKLLNIPSSQLASILSVMELKGFLKASDDGSFSLN